MILGNLLIGVGYLLNYGLMIASYILLARVLLSWFNPDPRNPMVLLLRRLTDPPLRRIAELLPFLRGAGGLDWTPLVLFAVLVVLQLYMAKPLIVIGMRMAAGGPLLP